MKFKGTEVRKVDVDVDPILAIQQLRRDWLMATTGYPEAHLRSGKWYYSFHAAVHEHGKPCELNVIREMKYGEEAIYNGLQSLKYFYQQEINKEYERERTREAKYGADDVCTAR